MTGSVEAMTTEEVVDRLLDWFIENRGVAALLEAAVWDAEEGLDDDVLLGLEQIVMTLTSEDELLTWWLTKQGSANSLEVVRADPQLRSLLLQTIPRQEVASMLVELEGAESVLTVARENEDLRDLLIAIMPEPDIVDGLSNVIDLQVDEWGGDAPFQIYGWCDGVPFYVRESDRHERYHISIPEDTSSAPYPDSVHERMVYVHDWSYDDELHRTLGIEDPNLNRDLWPDTPNYLLNSLLTVRAAIARDTQEREGAGRANVRKLRRSSPQRGGRSIFD